MAAGLLALALLVPGGPALGQSAPSESCRPLLVDFIGRLKQYDIDAARDLIENIDLYCPPQNRVAARARLGQLVARLGATHLDQGGDPGGVFEEAKTYLPYGDHWELRRLLGDLAMADKRFDQATEHYFKSLELIDDVGFTSDPPDGDTIRAVHALASQALSLSALPVQPTTRGGSTAAYFAPTVRGISVPRKTPQITFLTGTAEFDPKGRATAEGLMPILRRETPNSVTVIGHTDERGSDSYNLDLSRQRAQALLRFIRDSGFAGTIQARWCGERVPVDLSNPDGFSQDERWRLNRRVEVLYGQGGTRMERYHACDQ